MFICLGEGDVADTLQETSPQQETLIKTRKDSVLLAKRSVTYQIFVLLAKLFFFLPSLKVSWMFSENKNVRHYGIFRQ